MMSGVDCDYDMIDLRLEGWDCNVKDEKVDTLKYDSAMQEKKTLSV